MATRLTKPVVREVGTRHHGELIVTLAPEGIYFREKGRRKPFILAYGVAYQRAVNDHVAAEKRAKAEARRERAKARRRGA